MDTDSFYSLVSGTCFTLVGLWWAVVAYRQDWLKQEELKKLAGGIYLSFLIPGLMSLGAQIAGDTPLIWRGVFVVAAGLGLFFTARLIAQTPATASSGFFRQNRWIILVLYGFILLFSFFPQGARWLGITPLQLEALFICLLILIAHGLTWEFMTTNLPSE